MARHAKYLAYIRSTLLLLCFSAPPLFAKDFNPEGGAGGGNFEARCEGGRFLIGVTARTGASVDQISIICARIAANGSVSDEWKDRTTHGGPGGSAPTEKKCANGEMINSMGLLTGPQPPHTVIRLIIFNCVSTTSPARHNLDVGAAPFFPTINQTCPQGEAAVGVQGRSGLYIDALGLLCSPLPFSPSPGPGPGPGPGPVADPCSAATGADHAVCTEHNKLRAKHGTPALTWSTELATFAKDWVNQCKLSPPDANGNSFFCHKSDCGGGNPNGENLSFHYPPLTPENVVQGWYCEINVYDFDNPKVTGGTMFGCNNNPDQVTGHFTQVVWADSAKLGCARNTCSLGGNSGELWACEYSPPGNFNANQPGVLTRNVPRPAQGLIAGHIPAASVSIPPQRTTAIISDVDLYDIPGGVGRVMGILRKGETYPLIQCREDNWCQLSAGWVWGSFVVRSHNR